MPQYFIVPVTCQQSSRGPQSPRCVRRRIPVQRTASRCHSTRMPIWHAVYQTQACHNAGNRSTPKKNEEKQSQEGKIWEENKKSVSNRAEKELRSIREQVDQIEDVLRLKLPSIQNHLVRCLENFTESSQEEVENLKHNLSVHEYHTAEQCEKLTKLLFDLDGVESHGNFGVRKVRKFQVVRIQKLLDEADELKSRAVKLKQQGGDLSNSGISTEKEDLLQVSDAKSESTEINELKQLVQMMKTRFDEVESQLEKAHEKIRSLEMKQSPSSDINVIEGSEKSKDLEYVCELDDIEHPEPEAENALVQEDTPLEPEFADDNGAPTTHSEGNGLPVGSVNDESNKADKTLLEEDFRRLSIDGNQFAVLVSDSDSDSADSASESAESFPASPKAGDENKDNEAILNGSEEGSAPSSSLLEGTDIEIIAEQEPNLADIGDEHEEVRDTGVIVDVKSVLQTSTRDEQDDGVAIGVELANETDAEGVEEIHKELEDVADEEIHKELEVVVDEESHKELEDVGDASNHTSGDIESITNDQEDEFVVVESEDHGTSTVN